MLLLAVLTALGLGELAVRIVGMDAPSRDTGIMPHPLWHHWHRPDHKFVYHVPNEAISQHIQFNAHGMRDHRSVLPRKPAGVYRIAVLGDSFCEALQVEESEGVVRQLESQLHAAGHHDVEVLNFGCSGFSSLLELVLLKEFALAFEPDLVVCLHHFSDITEDARLQDQVQTEKGEIKAVPARRSGTSRRIRRVLEVSQLYRVANTSVDRWRRHRAIDPSASLQTSFDAIVHMPYTAEDEAAWSCSLAGVQAMADVLRARRIPMLMALIPIGTQVEPVPAEFAAKTGFRYLAEGRILEHHGYQERMAGFCESRGVACIDLLPIFKAANPAGEPLLYLQRDQHWTAAGHALAARAIAEHVARGKRPPPKSMVQ